MANDINLWSDIVELEHEGKQEEAQSLQEIYHYRYIEFSSSKLEEAKDKHFKKYRYTPNV